MNKIENKIKQVSKYIKNKGGYHLGIPLFYLVAF